METLTRQKCARNISSDMILTNSKSYEMMRDLGWLATPDDDDDDDSTLEPPGDGGTEPPNPPPGPSGG